MARTRRTANQPMIFKGEDFPAGVRQMSYNRRIVLGLVQHEICTDANGARYDAKGTKGEGRSRAWWKRRATKQVRRQGARIAAEVESARA